MAETNIDFDNIPTSLRKPGVYTEYNSRNAVSTLPTNEQNVLIVAPMLNATKAFSAPTPIYSDVDAKNTFGAGSWAHLMARIAIQNNAMIRLTVIGLKDSDSGVAATGTITLTGTASNAGVLKVIIGGLDYAVAIAKSETASNIAARLNAVINAGEYCPVSATVNEGTVTLTAKCKGDIGNEISVNATLSANDMAVNVSALANGAENADLAAALASVAGQHYHVIISPFADDKNAKALREHLESVASPVEKKPGVGVLGFNGTLASGTTYTEKINANRITVGWYKGAVESNALIAAG